MNRKLVLVVAGLLLATLAFSLGLDTLPAWQPGDDEPILEDDGSPVVLTVGMARLSLWYADQYNIVLGAASRFELQARNAAANERIAVDKLADIQPLLDAAETARDRNGWLAVAGFGLATVLLIVIVART